MTDYVPADTVLPEYTDEALRNETVYRGEVAATLLRVPAVFRQPVEAEVSGRAYTTKWHRRDGGLSEAESVMVADPYEVRRQVVAEVLAQLARDVEVAR